MKHHETMQMIEMLNKQSSIYAALDSALEVLTELQECSEYWSEYDVPLGIHERIAEVIKIIKEQGQ